MAKPHEITHTFTQLAPNPDLLEKLWHKQGLEYIRTRLRTIRLLWEGNSRQDVMRIVGVSQSTIIRWMRTLIEHGVDEGLRRLATPKKVPRPGKLSREQQDALIDMIENKHPSAYGFEQHIFTGAMLAHIVEKEWGIHVTDQTIYNILGRNRFSYQRGHRDYEPADPAEQQAYGEQLKKNWQRRKRAKKSCSSMNSGSQIVPPSSTAGRG
jgi:transposase